MNLITNFIHLNQNVCSKIEGILPHTKPDLTLFYDELVANFINQKTEQVIADLGSGRTISYSKKISPHTKPLLIALDYSQAELKYNKIATKKLVADLNSSLPIPKSSVHLLTSRYLLEHLDNPDTAFKNMHQVLRKNGQMVHLFSGKNAPFALLNRLLPANLSQKLLLWLVPGSKDVRGFKTHYTLDYGYTVKLLQKNGFKISKVYLSYYQSRYFAFFVPLYLLCIVYELIIYKLNLKNLASYIIIIAQKR